MSSQIQYRNVTELRAGFWSIFETMPCRKNSRGNPKRQNDQPCDTRCAFVDWVDSLAREGAITQKLASNATL